MKPITFAHDKALHATTSAGLANVSIIGSAATVHFAMVLVDSGADYVQLPMWSASNAGVNMAGATSVLVNGSTGSAYMFLKSGVDLEIEGKKVTVDVLFDPRNGRPLLGRNGLRALGDAYGFDQYDWLWNT
jgi:predicted aspartyl protease